MPLHEQLPEKVIMLNGQYQYKYNPDDFRGMPLIGEDIMQFYKALETSRLEDSEYTRNNLELLWEDLFFSIKHREVEGHIAPSLASSMRKYFEGLLYD